jgi:hypothetical protein
MNPRTAGDFAVSTYALVCMGFLVLTAGVIMDRAEITSPWSRIFTGGIVAGFMIAGMAAQFVGRTYLYHLSPIAYYAQSGTLSREDSAEIQLLRALVPETEGVEQIPFNLHFYIRSDRLPALGIFYWMPWMNDYAKNPIPGYPLPFCDEMAKVQPKAILYGENDNVWGNPTDSFAGCVKSLLDKKYFKLPRVGKDVWVRADVVADNPEALRNAIIPYGFDESWLSARERQAIHAAKFEPQRLSDIKTNSCIGQDRQTFQPIDVGRCTADSATLSLRVEGDAFLVMSYQAGDCVEIVGASSDKDAPARYWPCSGADNQRFTVEHAGNGIRLRNKFSHLCLAAQSGHLVQETCDQAAVWRWRTN